MTLIHWCRWELIGKLGAAPTTNTSIRWPIGSTPEMGTRAAILLSPDNLYIFSLKQRRQIPFKLQRVLHSHPENTRGNISIPASHTESESTEANTIRPVLY